MDLANRIKLRRIERGLTAQFIAEQLGVSTSTYFDWENGRQIRGEEHYESLSIILQMSLTELITGK